MPTNSDDGFTLVELLVVVLIIGVLAAIALPTFLGQSVKAQDAAAKSDVRNAVTQMESCLAPEEQSISDCIASSLTEFSDVNADDLSSQNHGSYRVTATSAAGSGHTYSITQRGMFWGYLYSAGANATGKQQWESNSTSP